MYPIEIVKKKKNFGFWCYINRPLFPSCFEPHYESKTKCKVFVVKISFHTYANKTNFHMKSLTLSLAYCHCNTVL